MTREKKNLLTGALIVVIAYIATLWQRPMFAPQEFDFAILSMKNSSSFAAELNGLFGKALKFNIVSVRLLPALSAIICALCVRALGKKMHGEGFGNISALIFLSTGLVFAFATSCLKEMINTMLFTLAVSSAFAAFELEKESPEYLRYLLAAAGGCATGFFASSMGLDSMLFPLMAIAFYAIFARPPHAKPIAVTGFICALAVFFLWQIDHKMVLFSKYGTIDFSRAGLLIAGSFPWVLLLPQAVMGAMKNRREFFRRRSVIFSCSAIVSGILVFPVAGILSAAVMVSPFAALLFCEALKEAENDQKALKISTWALRLFSLLILIFTAALVVTYFTGTLPAKLMYRSKYELAGFAVACAAALIQFQIAIDGKPQNKVGKLLHIATGAAVMMILFPGAIPDPIKAKYAHEDFFISTAGRYMAPDAVIYADKETFSTAKWIFHKHKVILLNKRTCSALAKRLEKRKNTAIFLSYNKKFPFPLPKNRMLFVRRNRRVILCQ